MTHRRFAAFTLALAAILTGCSSKQEQKAEGEKSRPVEVTDVKRNSIARLITADGILRAADQSSVTPKIAAPVSRFLVNRGDHVQKGQVIAMLESRDLAAAVTDAKGAYDQASANYRSISTATVPEEVTRAQAEAGAARQAMEAAQKLLDSRQQLYRDGALARRQVDEAAVAFAQAKSQYDIAQKHLESFNSVARLEAVNAAAAQRDSAQAKYEAAQAQLSYAEIRSPISGVVTDRPLFPGEMANPGSALLTIMDVSRVIARVSVPQSEARYVRVGQPARIAATDGSAESAGKVTVVSPAVDPQSTTVEVWVEAPNPAERMRPGGPVHVAITADTVQNAILVPPSALFPSQEGGSAVVTVDNESIAHAHKVQVGIRTPESVQILEGVDEGARVVVAGGLGLEDGAKVQVGKP